MLSIDLDIGNVVLKDGGDVDLERANFCQDTLTRDRKRGYLGQKIEMERGRPFRAARPPTTTLAAFRALCVDFARPSGLSLISDYDAVIERFGDEGGGGWMGMTNSVKDEGCRKMTPSYLREGSLGENTARSNNQYGVDSSRNADRETAIGGKGERIYVLERVAFY